SLHNTRWPRARQAPAGLSICGARTRPRTGSQREPQRRSLPTPTDPEPPRARVRDAVPSIAALDDRRAAIRAERRPGLAPAARTRGIQGDARARREPYSPGAGPDRGRSRTGAGVITVVGARATTDPDPASTRRDCARPAGGWPGRRAAAERGRSRRR